MYFLFIHLLLKFLFLELGLFVKFNECFPVHGQSLKIQVQILPVDFSLLQINNETVGTTLLFRCKLLPLI